LNIRDPHSDFYQEGLYALWNAYNSYKPEKGPMGTYFNFIIRNRLIDLIRKEVRLQENDKEVVSATSALMTDGNQLRSNDTPAVLPQKIEFPIKDERLWQLLEEHLSANQWTWVRCFVIQEMRIKEIADQENTTADAVKGWAREVRRKLRCERFRAKIGWYI